MQPDKKSKYEIIRTLKAYIYKVKNIHEFEELDILLSEIKSFIYANSELEEEFISRITKYKEGKFYKHRCLFATRAYRAVLNEINIHPEDKREKLMNDLQTRVSQTRPEYGYLYLLDLIMRDKESHIVASDSLAGFFIDNLYKHQEIFTIDSLTFLTNAERLLNSYPKKLSQLISMLNDGSTENIDFYALKFEDLVIFGRATMITNDFYPKWIKSALLGVLYELHRFMKASMQDEEELLTTQKLEIIEKIKKDKFSADLINIIQVILTNDGISKEALAEKTILSESTVKNRLRLICKHFLIKGELEKVKEVLEIYHFTCNDI